MSDEDASAQKVTSNDGRLIDRYFHDVSKHPLFVSKDEESAAAQAVVQAEVEHWVALLTPACTAEHVLTAVAAKIAPFDPPAPFNELLRRARRAQVKPPTVKQNTDYLKHVRAFALAVRSEDTGRHIMTAAHAAAYRHAAENRARIARTFQAQLAVKERFANANLRLVIAAAKRYTRVSTMPLADAIQDGNLGLMIAVERFDPLRGLRFSTYATWWIKQAIHRAGDDMRHVVRIPVHLQEVRGKVSRVIRAELARTGCPPDVDDLAHKTGVSKKKLRALELTPFNAALSLDAPHNDDMTLGDVFTDMSELSPFEHLVRSREGANVTQMIQAARLAPREARILDWRFGLSGDEALTLDEIGTKLNVSRERVRQLEALALGKLRRHLQTLDLDNAQPQTTCSRCSGARFRLYGKVRYKCSRCGGSGLAPQHRSSPAESNKRNTRT